MTDDQSFLVFVLVGMAIVFFFCIGLPVLLAYRLAVRSTEREDIERLEDEGGS